MSFFRFIVKIYKYVGPVQTLCSRPPDLWPSNWKLWNRLRLSCGTLTPILVFLHFFFIFQSGARAGQTDGQDTYATYCGLLW